MKFSTRLIFWGLLLTSLPMSLIGYLSYELAQDTLKQEATQRIQTVQLLMRENFERWINGNLQVLRSIALRPLVIQLAQKHFVLDRHAEAGHLDYFDNLTQVHLKSAVGERGGFKHLSFLHPDTGQILASTQSKTVGQFRERKRFFTQGRSSSFVDKLEYNPTSGEIYLHISMPVIAEGGELVGVIAGSVDWGEMTQILSQGKVGNEATHTYLLNSFAYPVVLPNRDKNQGLPLRAFHSSGIDQCLAGFQGDGEYLDYNATEVVGVYQWLAGYGFCLITEQPAKEVYHSLTALTEQWLIIFITTLGFAIVISLLVTRRILLPLNKLLFGVTQVTHGNLLYRVPKPSRDEIGRVAKSFNSMLDQLQLLTTSRTKLTAEIEERKQVESRLRDAEMLYRSLFDQSPDGILLINPITFKIVRFNTSAHETLGWTREEFATLYFYDFEAEFDLARLKDLVEDLRIKRTVDMNSQLKHHDQKLIRVKVTISLVEVDGQELIHAVFRDISEILQRMADLEQSETRFRRAITAAPFPVLIHTGDGEILQVSDSWLVLTGYEISEMRDVENLTHLFIGDKFSTFIESPTQLLENDDKINDGEFNILSRNGDRLTWDFSSTSVGKLSDNREVFMRMAVDVTGRNKNQEKLEQSNKDLQQFAYVASHDLQEPLRVITGFIELLAKRYQGQLDDKADKYIDFITDGADRMRNLISGLLSYSRVISRHNPRKYFDVNDALREVTQDLSVLLEETGAEVTYDEQPHITAEKDQIKQVFQNLISNAIKFNKSPNPAVKISSYLEQGYWSFSVCDNGIGIDEKYRQRIFDIFQRLHSREEYDGTGIGLSITKRVIERHSGKICVHDSELGGTCFTFTIPENAANDNQSTEEI